MPRTTGQRRRRPVFGSVISLTLCCSLSIAGTAKALPGKDGAVRNAAAGHASLAPTPTPAPAAEPPPQPPPQPPLVPGAIVRVDLSSSSPTPPLLWGLFVEEIQHAGDGGLYAELVQDRSFGGTARALGVGGATGRPEAAVPPGGAPWSAAGTPRSSGPAAASPSSAGGGREREWRRRRRHRHRRRRRRRHRGDDGGEAAAGGAAADASGGGGSPSVGDEGPVPGSGLPPAWEPLSDSSVVTLVAGSGGGGGGGDGEEPNLPPPLPPPPPEANGRRLSLRVARASPPPSESGASSSAVGVSNPGFWGIPVRPGDEFELVAWLFVPSPSKEEGGAGSSGSSGSSSSSSSSNSSGSSSSRGGCGGGDGDEPAAACSVVVELLVQNDTVAASAVLSVPSLGAWHRVGARLAVPAGAAPAATATATATGARASPPFASARLVVRTPGGSPPPPPQPPPQPPAAGPPPRPPPPRGSAPRAGPAFALAAVSLFPAANGPLGSASPFRADLLRSLRRLRPRFLRVPGGCYVEGDTLADAFDWASTVAAPLARPGHWDGPWRYWSSDGLGLFEWLLLAEALGAPAVWVQSAGVAHRESLPTSGGGAAALAESALGALEFALGDAGGGGGGGGGALASSPWAGLRASVFNRSAPFPALAALAIGNEDCGKPFYATNFAAVREAVRLRFPGLPVVADCGGNGDEGSELDADLFDWHFYSSADDLWAHRDVFSGSSPSSDAARAAAVSKNGAAAFATEFAAFDWGISTLPAGWVKGAAAEAGFMTGLENAAMTSSSSSRPAVAGGAFAPALAHGRSTDLCPTSLLVFDAGSSFETPSFFVQELFANAAGRALAACSTTSSSGGVEGGVAASASCERERCGGGGEGGGDDESPSSSSSPSPSSSSSSSVSVKVVNYGPPTRRVRVAFVQSRGVNGSTAGVPAPVPLSRRALVTLLAHPDPAASNSFALPTKVAPLEVEVGLDEAGSEEGLVELEMPPYSLAVLRVFPLTPLERSRRKERREPLPFPRKERALGHEEQR